MTCSNEPNLEKYTGDSFRDLTRIAKINDRMWSELFLSNKDNVMEELDYFINSLQQYRNAISQSDSDTLIRLLDEGRKRKEEVDG